MARCRRGLAKRQSAGLRPFHRRLRIEPLEDRRLLASVVVSNNLDLVNGNTASISSLTANDGGDGISLREAILAANATAGGDEVTFAFALSGVTITLGGTELEISEALTIDARPLAANVTINANQASRIFNITATTGDFTLAGLTLTGGRTTADNANVADNTFCGGAIRSLTSGNLTLDQSTVSGNSTAGSFAHGGGIYASYGSTVTLAESTVSGNSTTGSSARGGGIFAFYSSTVTLTQSIVSGNSTTGSGARGGGISASLGSTVSLTQSTVSGNSTAGSSARGGGIFAGIVTLTQSTVSGNSTAEDFADGGGIYASIVTLTESSVSGNSTEGDNAPGGGIAAGTMTLTQSTVSGNSTTGIEADGGGIYAGSSLTLTQSTVSGNSTAGGLAHGGGICASYGSTVTLTQSTVSGNSTAGIFTHGGGIKAISVTLTQSTVSGNWTTGFGAVGGGIWAYAVTLSESTVSGNSTTGSSAHGGGIYVSYRGTVTLTQTTVTENRALHATSSGGGVFQVDSAFNRPFSISGSIVAGNTAGGGGADLVPDPQSTLTVNYSLIGTGIAPTAGGNNVVTDNPQLGPLINNGGPTQTRALLAGSPAINMGDPSAVAGMGDVPEFDQRGLPFSRVAGGRIDIGAYEQQSVPMGGLVVDTLMDEIDGDSSAGNLSLREAISLAQGIVGPNTITFAPSLTSGGPASILLALGELPIVASLTINGPGANLLTIDAGDASRIFSIDDGTSAVIDVEILGLALTGGNVVSGSGGAIFNTENLSLWASNIRGNSVSSLGGGIFNAGSVTVTASTITENEAFSGGGGIFNAGGDLEITASTISGNRSLAFGFGGGGGIYTQFGSTTVTNSTLSGNTSHYQGGGIYHDSGPLTITNSTLSGNTANNEGGGMYSRFGLLAVRHSTITGNQALGMNSDPIRPGGGILRSGSGAYSMNLEHTIVAGNSGQFSGDDLRGAFTVRYSLIGMQTGQTFLVDNGGNLIGNPGSPIDPLLGPLANNGGPTMTHALLAGSPAIDAGDPAAFAGIGNVPLDDQRGAPFTRVFDGDGTSGARIDIGAFELQPPPGPVLPGDYNENGVVDAADYVLFRKYQGTNTPLANDAIGGVIGPAHYEQWTANFGESLPGAGSGGQVGRAEGGGGKEESEEQGAGSGEQELVFERFAAAVQRRMALRRLADVLVDVGERDDALVAWVASRQSGGGRREEEAIEAFGRRGWDERSGESVLDAVDSAFEGLLADAT